MLNPEELAEIQDYLETLLQATRSGGMEWRAVNPTTYSWETSGPAPARARLSLQRIEQTTPGFPAQKKYAYLLQAFEIRGSSAVTRATVNGLDDLRLNDQLGRLFDAISGVHRRQSLDFLKSVLPGETPKD